MKIYNQSKYQKNQIRVINQIVDQIKSNSLQFSVVSPVEDYENDLRMCLTGVHLLKKDLITAIQNQLLTSLIKIEPRFYYYKEESLHMTIKNIRTIYTPPHFSNKDIKKSLLVFKEVVPKHKSFQVYFYRLVLFPNNLALVGTTDSELDAIHLELDRELRNNGVPDDKEYINKNYFFSNITLARFSQNITDIFRDKVNELSNSIHFLPYTVDSVTLLTANAVLKNQTKIHTWFLS